MQECKNAVGMVDSTQYHLVHFNLAVARYPLDHPEMREFVDQIESVNGRGATSPGFVWMLPAGEGDAETIFGSSRALPNMTVWTTLEDLRRFTYEGRRITPFE